VKKGVLFYFERKGRRRVRCRILKEVEGGERERERESHRKRSVCLLVAEAKIEAHGHWINLKIIKS
jgi:hypothetical protein